MPDDLSEIRQHIRQNVKNLIELDRKIREFQKKLNEVERQQEKKEPPK